MNYLNGRQQIVQIVSEHSGYEEVIQGIPQGSIQGPRLHYYYIILLVLMIYVSSFLSMSYLQTTHVFLGLGITLNY